MKILEMFGEPISHGGEEAFVMNVLTNMDRSGMRIDLLTPYYCNNKSYQKTVHEMGGRIYSFGLPFAPGKSRGNICRPLRKFLKKHHYDVVHIHSGSISVLILGAESSKRAGIRKVLVHSHVAGVVRNWKYWVLKAASFPFMMYYPDVYCACSLAAAEWKFPRWVTKKRLHLLKNGVDLEKYGFSPGKRRKIRALLHISERTLAVGHVGRFSYQKNQEFLVQVFAELQKKCPDSRLILIGSGEDEKKIRQLVEELDLVEQVLFLGNVDNVQDYLSAMDVFALPSRFEGLPLAGVEAAANGLPIVVSDGVSREFQLVPEIRFCSLEEPSGVWAELLLEGAKAGRKDCSDMLREKGYDIKATAKEVRTLYLSTIWRWR